MPHPSPTRRDFLAQSATTLAAASLAPRALGANNTWQSEAAFPPAKPSTLRVSKKKLQTLTAYIESEMNAGTFPGAGVMAIRHGKMFLNHYCGAFMAGGKTTAPFSERVRVPFYSFSKAISATVVVMAHQDGLVDYDVPVSKYIPEFTSGGKDAITLRHLLTHSAGIPNAPIGRADTEETWRESVKSVCATPVEWEPGNRTQYHGLTGLFVAAEAVRRVSAMKPWNDICRERLFNPIGADSLSFALSGPEPGPLDAFASKGSLLGHPAGGCAGTLIDMLKVVQLHLNGGLWQGRVLINPEAFKEMHTVQYAAEIAKDVAAGKTPRHETWGLGWLLRGAGTRPPAAYWFGFGDHESAAMFGHAGIDTIMGVGDPSLDIGYAFCITKSIGNEGKADLLRKEVANRIFDALT